MVNLYGTAFLLKIDLDKEILSRYFTTPCIWNNLDSSDCFDF